MKYLLLFSALFPCVPALAQMDVGDKIFTGDEIFDAKISAGYLYLFGMGGIYAADLSADPIVPEKIATFNGNDLRGRLMASRNWIAATYNQDGENILAVYDTSDFDSVQSILGAKRVYSSITSEREFERFEYKNFFLDGPILYYYALGESHRYDLSTDDLCDFPIDGDASWGYLKIGKEKIFAGHAAYRHVKLDCEDQKRQYLEYIVGPMTLTSMEDSNNLMEKYGDKILGGTIGFWDEPGVAHWALGFKLYDTSRVGEGYLLLENNFNYHALFIGRYGWAVDGEKQMYDIQDMLVKNGYVYLSSYFTCSIVSFDASTPWDGSNYAPRTEFSFLEPKEACYCWVPEECYQWNHPFGMAAANNKLYVADKDYLYVLRLKRDDEGYPRGNVTSLPAVWSGKIRIEGWADDGEGIRSVAVRIGRRQYFAEPAGGRHRRPVGNKYYWQADIDLEGWAGGEYDVKVIAEDMDGDFSIILETQVNIQKTTSGDSPLGGLPGDDARTWGRVLRYKVLGRRDNTDN